MKKFVLVLILKKHTQYNIKEQDQIRHDEKLKKKKTKRNFQMTVEQKTVPQNYVNVHVT